jgi:uncharacterized protein (UPF0332 family)
MDEIEIRRREALALYRKAEHHLEDAQLVAEQDVFTLAVVGAYTAAELAAKALVLLKPGLELPFTHGGMIQTFSREYVKTGEVPRRWGRLLNEKLQLRSEALYDTEAIITRDDAQSIIELAREMVTFLSQKLEEYQNDI